MIDIVILCLRGDARRAGAILDALGAHGPSAKHRTRFIPTDPMDVGWSAARERAAAADCVVMCWSSKSLDEACADYRRFGTQLFESGTIISVELDSGSLPPELRETDCYPLGQNSHGAGFLPRLLFGNPHAALIAAAAGARTEGQDPPPASSVAIFRRRELKRRLLRLGAVVGALGTAVGLSTADPVRKMIAPNVGNAFEKARATGECAPMEKFSTDHPGSPWTDEAIEFMARCRRKPIRVGEVERYPVRAGRIDLRHSGNENRAKAEGKEALHRIADDYCRTYAANIGASLKPVSVEGVTQGCDHEPEGWICVTKGWAVCPIQRTQPAAE